MNMEERSLRAKLEQLDMAKDQVEGILQTNDSTQIQRQQERMRNLIREADSLKNTVEHMKLVQNVSRDEIRAWNVEFENEIGEANVEVARLTDWLDRARQEETGRQNMQLLELWKETKKHDLLMGITKNLP